MSTKKGDPQLSELSKKLDMLIRLSALSLVKDAGTQKQQIALLSDAGLGPKAIAGILATTENTVNVTLNVIRKERSSKEVKEETTPKGTQAVTKDEEAEKNGEEKATA